MATALAAILAPLSAWLWSTTTVVADPYLDEVFHVRQAQHYCAGHLDVWDPKITTPPGLYFLSVVASPLLGCGITALRGISALCIGLVLLVVVAIFGQRKSNSRNSWLVEHCSLNIALFPPLFFFSALYYTDVASTLSVLVFYWWFLRVHQKGTPAWLAYVVLVVLGLASLMFRQTNIFWVAIFPAGLVLFDEIDRGHDAVRHSAGRGVEGFGDTCLSIARMSYKHEIIFDLPVRDAKLEDFVNTIISIASCLAKTAMQPQRLARLFVRLLPYGTVLGCFVAFVVWNGSVVLGDKSNHVATLHVAQMMYLWPYVTFFSWPLLWPYLFIIPFGLLSQLLQIAPLEKTLVLKRRQMLPRVMLLGIFLVAGCLVAHFNTIVHPFSLADNRHYTFYVFRLLTRPWWMKFLATPIYVVCAWACIQAMGARPRSNQTSQASKSRSTSGGSVDSSSRAKPLRVPDGVQSARTTFLLLWLGTSALQLVTAPLVEPRYCILPWLFWRMHLPVQLPATEENDAWVDWRLWVETAWHLAVHATAAYIFLYWGFAWPQEVGKVQRFMW